jgi:hypothetical protein
MAALDRALGLGFRKAFEAVTRDRNYDWLV